jgi:hypothetical protein
MTISAVGDHQLRHITKTLSMRAMLCEVTDKSIQEISMEVGYQLEAFRVFFTKI